MNIISYRRNVIVNIITIALLKTAVPFSSLSCARENVDDVVPGRAV